MRVNLEQKLSPNPVLGLLMNISKVQTDPRADFEASTPPRWAPAGAELPLDSTEAWLYRAAGVSTELADRSADIRALLTAYSQAVATDRPELSKLAQWQKISPSALRHRYNDQHVQAVRELLEAEPMIDIVLEPFISIVDTDLLGINESLDVQIDLRTRMREIVAQEFTSLFSNRLAKQLRLTGNPAGERNTRLIDDLMPSIDTALQRHAPELLPIFLEWHERFGARSIKQDDVKQTGTRVRRSSK